MKFLKFKSKKSLWRWITSRKHGEFLRCQISPEVAKTLVESEDMTKDA